MANDVKEDKQVAVFLSVVGASTYGLLRTLLTLDKPSEKSLADLTSALVAHYEPKPMVITQWFHFHRRNQDPTESISEYVAALRKLSTFCDFGDQLDNALRDRLVCGVHSEALQKVLLSTKDLTFKAAMEKALSMEAADHNTKELHAKGPLPVNKVAKSLPTPRVSASSTTTQPSQSRTPHQRPHQRAHQSSRSHSQSCYRCGKNNHQAHQCRYLESICHSCGKKGHIASVCRSRRRSAARTHAVNISPEEELPPVEELHLFRLGFDSKSTSQIVVELTINALPISMEVDTGAEVSVMSEAKFRQFFPEAKLHPSHIQLKSYTGNSIPVCGETMVQVTYGAQSAFLPLVVVTGDRPSLMGRNWLHEIKLDWKNIATITRPQSSSPDALIRRYPRYFRMV